MAQFNVFEGSRRIALLIKVLWVIGVIVVAYSQTPYVSITMFTGMPDDPFARIADMPCGTDDDSEYVTREFAPGRTVSVHLCFMAATASDNRRLIPFRMDADGKRWMGNEKYTSEVMNYTAARGRQFALSADDRSRAAELWDAARWENLRNAGAFLVGGWIVLCLLQLIIGWIVRGFMGIPWGQDRRPEQGQTVPAPPA